MLIDKAKLLRLSAGAVIFAIAIILKRIITDNLSSLVYFNVPFVFFIVAYFVLGGDVIFRALKNILRGQVFDENFLMSIATIGALAIGESAEAVGVMLFYQVGEYFMEMAVKKSKNSITELMNIRPDYANLVKGDSIEKVSPDTVQIDDVIIVKPGEKIPLDGVVIEGSSMLDTSALTGESVPRKVTLADMVLSGCVNQTGLLKVRVTKIYSESKV
jgi:Cd2+/Zn2+-exporting ATPase